MIFFVIFFIHNIPCELLIMRKMFTKLLKNVRLVLFPFLNYCSLRQNKTFLIYVINETISFYYYYTRVLLIKLF